MNWIKVKIRIVDNSSNKVIKQKPELAYSTYEAALTAARFLFEDYLTTYYTNFGSNPGPDARVELVSELDTSKIQARNIPLLKTK